MNIAVKLPTENLSKLSYWSEQLDEPEKVCAFLADLRASLIFDALVNERKNRADEPKGLLYGLLSMDIPCRVIDIDLNTFWICVYVGDRIPTSFYYRGKYAEKDMTLKEIQDTIAKNLASWLEEKKPDWPDYENAIERCRKYFIL